MLLCDLTTSLTRQVNGLMGHLHHLGSVFLEVMVSSAIPVSLLGKWVMDDFMQQVNPWSALSRLEIVLPLFYIYCCLLLVSAIF